MRKIAFISEHASPLATIGGTDSGGQNVYVAQLAIELAKNQFSVDIFTRWEDEKTAEIIEWLPNIRVIHVEAGPKTEIPKEELLPYMSDFFENMYGFVATSQINYELVHANFWMSGLVAMKMKERMGIPYVVTFHALGYIRKLHQKENDRFPEARLDIEKQVAEKADVVVAECPQDKDDLVEYYKIKPSKITIIPCGFSPDEFMPIDKGQCRKQIGLDADDFILLQLGRMVPRKGVDNVIRALPYLKVTNKKVKLVIVGGEKDEPVLNDHSEVARLFALAVDLKVDHLVKFVGRKERKQLKYFYSAADVFITTPWYEPFGITPLEAMACGTPVIGSNVGGIKYSVADGKTGFLVEPKKPAELADKIQLLADDPVLIDKFRKYAIERVNKQFTWEQVAAQMSSVYERILNSYGDPAVINSALIDSYFSEAYETFKNSARVLNENLILASKLLANALAEGKKILICGNGGSAAESQHMAAELVGRFEIPYRSGLPAISLTADTSILTAWSNDFGFEDVFARQVQAYGTKGDVLICFSTSGQSPNILKAQITAEKLGIKCVNILGKEGGAAAKHGDLNLIVPSDSSQRIQEVHLFIVHVICKLIEKRLFESRIVVNKNKTILCDTEKQYF